MEPRRILILVIVTISSQADAAAQIGNRWSDYPEPPIQSFARSVVAKPAVGPPLRPYSRQPLAHKLKTSSDTETRVGSVMNLRVITIHAGDSIQAPMS
jgi:hypothetical protein